MSYTRRFGRFASRRSLNTFLASRAVKLRDAQRWSQLSMQTFLVLLLFAVSIQYYLSLDVITTIAGTGTGSFSGDGGAATSATLNYACGVTVDAAGRPM